MSFLARLMIYTSITCALQAGAGEKIALGNNAQVQRNFPATADSYRLSFDLGTARRFASRFLKNTRTLELRVLPATASEFETSSFYDTRFVKRVVIREEGKEVILGLQLKNIPVRWLVTYQENPWRLVVDLWRDDASKDESLEEEWNWQQDVSSGAVADIVIPMATPIAVESPTRETTVVEIPKVELPASEPVKPEPSRVVSNQTPKTGVLPENFGRIQLRECSSTEKLADLQRAVGGAVGTSSEFPQSLILAKQLYQCDRFNEASAVLRRMAALAERDFESDPEALWIAGESGYLTSNMETSTDYLRALLLRHPTKQYSPYAVLRLTDMEYLKALAAQDTPTMERIRAKYAEMAIEERTAYPVRIAAMLRIVHDAIDKNPDAARMYQQVVDTCVNKSLVPFEMRRNCSYIKARAAVDSLDILQADSEVRRFAEFSDKDPRVAKLEEKIVQRVRSTLAESNNTKNWEAWLALEKQARPALISFTLEDDGLLRARAEAWESAGDAKRAAQFYALSYDAAKGKPERDEVAALAARILRKAKNTTKSEFFVEKIAKSETRRRSGLTPRTAEMMRELSLPPYRSRRALQLVLDEMQSGRFVERELGALVEYTKILPGAKNIDVVYEKIRAYPAKSPNEISSVETSIIGYASKLASQKKTRTKAADLYLAVAKLPEGTRRAEAALRAGENYYREGEYDKARDAWQISATDVSRNTYSAKAEEWLDKSRR